MAENAPVYGTGSRIKKPFAQTFLGRIFKGFTVHLALEFLARSIEANDKLTDAEKDKAISVLETLTNMLLPEAD